jgi:hypothetical protein
MASAIVMGKHSIRPFIANGLLARHCTRTLTGSALQPAPAFQDGGENRPWQKRSLSIEAGKSAAKAGGQQFRSYAVTKSAGQFNGFGGPVPTFFQTRPPLPMNTVVRFVPQQTAWIVERMGKFSRILQPGLAILIPFLDRIAYVKSLKESAMEIPSQSCITADNVTLELDGILYTRIVDAYKARYVIGDTGIN